MLLAGTAATVPTPIPGFACPLLLARNSLLPITLPMAGGTFATPLPAISGTLAVQAVGPNPGLPGGLRDLERAVAVVVKHPGLESTSSPRWTSHRDLPPPVRDELPQEVYDELRALAGQLFRAERANHTLQPTALVHEAWLRLAREPGLAPLDRVRTLAVAAKIMRRLLVDHARRRAAAKRGSGAVAVTLDESLIEGDAASVDVLALHEALEVLETLHARQAQIVERRYFGGMTMREVAGSLGVGLTTVEQDWRMAKAWLTVRLRTEPGR